MAIEQLGQPFPHVHHRRPYRQIQHGLGRTAPPAAEQPVGVIARDGRVRLQPLGLDRQPHLEVELPDPSQQPVKIIRGLRIGTSVMIGVRIQAGAYAPVQIEQKRLRSHRRRVLGQRQHRGAVVGGEGRPGGVEDHRGGRSAGGPQRGVQPGGGGVQAGAPRPEDPRRVIGLPRPQGDFAGGQQLTTAEIGPPARGQLRPVTDRPTERDVHLPHLTPPEAGPRLAQHQLLRPSIVMGQRQPAGSHRHRRHR